jgi:hypothetical protein
MAKQLKWGSPEWRTHLRRSLAQRKRHGEDIKDVEGLIDYIERNGPDQKNPANKISRTTGKVVGGTPRVLGGVTVNIRSSRTRIK